MTLQEIKQSCDILEIAQTLGINIDQKTHKACCPFHADKTPSLQFSREKQIATCFSSNCDAGTMDVISLTAKKLNLSTHEALKYLQTLIDETGKNYKPTDPNLTQKPSQATIINYKQDFEVMQSSFLSSTVARNYANTRNLDAKKLEIGYNAFKSSKFNYLRGCIAFGLKDNEGKIVSMYGRSVRDNDKAKHYYTANRTGLYPTYPPPSTRKLILTESIIDTATLLSIDQIKSSYEILALYGTNGLTEEHNQAIQNLENLEEIILFFDGDEAGKTAIEKQGRYLKEILQKSKAKISIVETPEDEDINSLAEGHTQNIFIELLNSRKAFLESGSLFFSEEEALEKQNATENETETEIKGILVSEAPNLNTSNPNKINYRTENATYYIKGGIRKDLDSLKVTLVVEHLETKTKSRNKLDLYEDKQTEKIARESAEKLGLRSDLIEQDLNQLTDLLDDFRESQAAETTQEKTKKVVLSSEEKSKCIGFLKQENLLSKINELIGKAGVVGEENSRIFLFGIASSYKMQETLHGLIQGSSGSGKTHLLASIMDFIPEEDRISLTRVTESSFYNYGQYELQNKLIGIEDYDGLEEKAELAFRELQSKGMISSSTSGKNEVTGEIAGYIKTVYGPIASLSATTKGEIYEDNMSRCFLVAVDETYDQTLRIIGYQNDKSAGLIDKQKEKETSAFLRNCIRLLSPLEVINPYANKIELPRSAHKIRRLNDLFQSYVKQVTIINQYNRKKDRKNRLITDKKDVSTAIEIMFDSIILKVDELDGSLRLFYERLKKYVMERGEEYAFLQREIRHALKVSKTQLQRYINQLEELEYVQKKGFGSHGAVKYKIVYWDDNKALRAKIKRELNAQIERL